MEKESWKNWKMGFKELVIFNLSLLSMHAGVIIDLWLRDFDFPWLGNTGWTFLGNILFFDATLQFFVIRETNSAMPFTLYTQLNLNAERWY